MVRCLSQVLARDCARMHILLTIRRGDLASSLARQQPELDRCRLSIAWHSPGRNRRCAHRPHCHRSGQCHRRFRAQNSDPSSDCADARIILARHQRAHAPTGGISGAGILYRRLLVGFFRRHLAQHRQHDPALAVSVTSRLISQATRLLLPKSSRHKNAQADRTAVCKRPSPCATR